MSGNAFWAEIGAEWIHDNWQRTRRGKPEIDWETYQSYWRGWPLCLRLNRYRLARARLHMREIARLLTSKKRLELGWNLLSLCLIAPDYLLSRLIRRCKSSRSSAKAAQRVASAPIGHTPCKAINEA